jgi:HAD superfamily hydrolase (TIGR01509 family)
MQWIHNFQLFLFDFDGLLVNTEEIHYMAYKRMLEGRGCQLDWDFEQYCQIAHYSSSGLEERIYERFPQLKESEPSWSVLYAEKKQAIIDLVNAGAVQLMPGVSDLLKALMRASISRCVVTHSPDELVTAVRSQHAILQTIPDWFTREHYVQPKPHPECYHMAIGKLAKPNDRIIGFEDTPRGLKALIATRATPVLICEAHYPEIPEFLCLGAVHYPSFCHIPSHAFF